MLRRALKSGLIVVVLAGAVQEANAFGHRGWGGCGWGGCGWGGYGYAGCGWGGCGYGYGGYGWYAGYGVPYGGYAGCGNGAAPAANSSAARPLVGNYSVTPDSVLLAVNVPQDAKVFINGHPTTSTGEHRFYTSNGLQSSTPYTYQIRAEFNLNGQPVTINKLVTVSAGQQSALDFVATAQAQMANAALSPPR